MSIPLALRQQVWLQYNGKTFQHKCNIKWCKNIITVFNFHVGHDIPRSKGGTLDLNNLKPICVNCNLSMSDNYSIKEWNKLGGHKVSWLPSCFFKYEEPEMYKKSRGTNQSSKGKEITVGSKI